MSPRTRRTRGLGSRPDAADGASTEVRRGSVHEPSSSCEASRARGSNAVVCEPSTLTVPDMISRPSWDVEQEGRAEAHVVLSCGATRHSFGRSVTQRPSWDREFEAREVPHRRGHRSVLVALVALVASSCDHDGIAYVPQRGPLTPKKFAFAIQCCHCALVLLQRPAHQHTRRGDEPWVSAAFGGAYAHGCWEVSSYRWRALRSKHPKI
jgi:hypothetical protein